MPTPLYNLRIARGQSLRQLQPLVGVSYETIRRLESGQQTAAKPSTRLKFERAFGVPFDVLIAPLDGLSTEGRV